MEELSTQNEDLIVRLKVSMEREIALRRLMERDGKAPIQPKEPDYERRSKVGTDPRQPFIKPPKIIDSSGSSSKQYSFR